MNATAIYDAIREGAVQIGNRNHDLLVVAALICGVLALSRLCLYWSTR